MFNKNILLILLAATCSHGLESQLKPARQSREVAYPEVKQTLFLDNPYDAGDWGIITLCQNGSTIKSAEVKWEEPNNLDETAINAIKLYCLDNESQELTYITSTEGDKGSYRGIHSCSDGSVTGVRVKILESQGLIGDDVAVQDFEISCNYGQETVAVLPESAYPLKYIPIQVPAGKRLSDVEQMDVEVAPRAYKEGTWSSWSECQAGLSVCGLQVRLDESILGDLVSVSDIVFFCCDAS